MFLYDHVRGGREEGGEKEREREREGGRERERGGSRLPCLNSNKHLSTECTTAVQSYILT